MVLLHTIAKYLLSMADSILFESTMADSFMLESTMADSFMLESAVADFTRGDQSPHPKRT